jgi:hypothetical protein
MGFDKMEMIKQLKFEIEMIEKGGYYPRFGNPATPRRSFASRLHV